MSNWGAAAHWLWWSRHPVARAGRTLLLPLSGAHRVVMIARARVYGHGWRRVHRLPLPAVAVGNLAVGGAGKTPIAAWIAGWFVRRGVRPGILLRGYGGDEALVHERLVPEAVVVPGADRAAGARLARESGAEVLVLDDAYQRLDVARDLNIVVMSVEQANAAPWPLPAGPWREGWGALGRADLIVVTRRRANQDAALDLAARLARRWPETEVAVAHLDVACFEGMRTGTPAARGALAGRNVVAAAGVADPGSFAGQLEDLGANVHLLAFQDHHAYSEGDVQRLLQAAGGARGNDHVVVTEKDAVKLRPRWPAGGPEPLVAVLAVTWDRNGTAVERALATLPALRRTPA